MALLGLSQLVLMLTKGSGEVGRAMRRIREGGRMDTTGVMVMGVFLGLCLLGLVWGLRQARQQREQAREFAAARGWQYTKYDPELGKRLESMNPATYWTATNVMHSGNLWLFSSQTRPRRGRSSSSFGMTCLVEHAAPQITATVGVDQACAGARETAIRAGAGAGERGVPEGLGGVVQRCGSGTARGNGGSAARAGRS